MENVVTFEGPKGQMYAIPSHRIRREELFGKRFKDSELEGSIMFLTFVQRSIIRGILHGDEAYYRNNPKRADELQDVLTSQFAVDFGPAVDVKAYNRCLWKQIGMYIKGYINPISVAESETE